LLEESWLGSRRSLLDQTASGAPDTDEEIATTARNNPKLEAEVNPAHVSLNPSFVSLNPPPVSVTMMMMMMMMMMMIISLFGQLGLWAPSSGVRAVFTSIGHVWFVITHPSVSTKRSLIYVNPILL
jgi:hypothetical protein